VAEFGIERRHVEAPPRHVAADFDAHVLGVRARGLRIGASHLRVGADLFGIDTLRIALSALRVALGARDVGAHLRRQRRIADRIGDHVRFAALGLERELQHLVVAADVDDEILIDFEVAQDAVGRVRFVLGALFDRDCAMRLRRVMTSPTRMPARAAGLPGVTADTSSSLSDLPDGLTTTPIMPRSGSPR
jgi:hypothetical protein